MTTPLACVRELARRLEGRTSDHDALLEQAGDLKAAADSLSLERLRERFGRTGPEQLAEAGS